MKKPTLSSLILPVIAIIAVTSPALHAKVDWKKQVWPFIERSCVDCHKAPYEEGGKIKEPKAELRFDGAWGIMAGGENGPVLVPGKAADSEMYFRVTLPEDDSDFMPSKGEVLTEAEKDLLKTWIEEGADFGGWEGSLEGKPEEKAAKPERKLAPLKPSIYETLAKGVKPPAKDAVEAVANSGARVEPLAMDHPFYRVDYFNARDDTNDATVAVLGKLKENIAQLNLAETGITDAGLKEVAGLVHLVRLDLHQTAIGDKGLAHLQNLSNLRYLNLYDTQVTDAGLRQLANLKNLVAVYLWKSKVTDKGVKNLQQKLPKATISWK